MYSITKWKKWLTILLVFIVFAVLLGCQSAKKEEPANLSNTAISEDGKTPNTNSDSGKIKIEEGLSYSTKEEVADYIYKFKELPQNFITKSDARDLGWDNSKGNLWDVTDKKSIGGDRFYNREGLLPEAEGRRYYECDINYHGGYRGAERIVYSNDGLIFYTDDHYSTFERLY
jgi:guanyl-specific ribonuclease Sa